MNTRLLIYILKISCLISTFMAPIAYLNFLVIYHSIILSLSSLILLSSMAIFSFYKVEKIESKENNYNIPCNINLKDTILIPLSFITGFCTLIVIMPDINKSDMSEVLYLNISRIIFPVILIISIYNIRKSLK